LAALAQLGPGDGRRAVCVLTGHGLKDTGELEGSMGTVVDATIDAVLGAIG
jgi:threonine synthase